MLGRQVFKLLSAFVQFVCSRVNKMKLVLLPCDYVVRHKWKHHVHERREEDIVRVSIDVGRSIVVCSVPLCCSACSCVCLMCCDVGGSIVVCYLMSSYYCCSIVVVDCRLDRLLFAA